MKRLLDHRIFRVILGAADGIPGTVAFLPGLATLSAGAVGSLLGQGRDEVGTGALPVAAVGVVLWGLLGLLGLVGFWWWIAIAPAPRVGIRHLLSGFLLCGIAAVAPLTIVGGWLGALAGLGAVTGVLIVVSLLWPNHGVQRPPESGRR